MLVSLELSPKLLLLLLEVLLDEEFLFLSGVLLFALSSPVVLFSLFVLSVSTILSKCILLLDYL